MVNHFDFLRENNGKHMHFRPVPYPNKQINKFYGEYEKGMPYLINVVGFWEKDFLYNLLIAGESPWNFEIMGSYRASYESGFYCLLSEPFKYVHGIEKGKWFEDAYQYLDKNSLLPHNNREVIKNKLKLKSNIQKIYFNTLIKIPWKTRVQLMNMLRKLFISY